MSEQQTKSIKYEVIEPSRVIVKGFATGIFLPGAAGEIGILYNHIPLLVQLGCGDIRVHGADGVITHVAVNGGYAQVRDNRVIILADEAVASTEIDVNEEKKALEELQQKKNLLEADGKRDPELDKRMKIIGNKLKTVERASRQ